MSEYVSDVHESLKYPESGGARYLVKGSYDYYHYLCDGTDDRGWGCGYRTLQTICSWISKNTAIETCAIPSIHRVQEILTEIGDKPISFLNSREWIGSFEVCLIIDELYDIPSKILHVDKGANLSQYVEKLKDHFSYFGCPVMMGGDKDCSSKGIMGVYVGESETHLLIVDPHFVGRPKSKALLQADDWVKWQAISEFSQDSFYNICLPQIKYRSF